MQPNNEIRTSSHQWYLLSTFFFLTPGIYTTWGIKSSSSNSSSSRSRSRSSSSSSSSSNGNFGVFDFTFTDMTLFVNSQLWLKVWIPRVLSIVNYSRWSARYRAETETSEEWRTLRVVPNDSSSMTIHRLWPHRTYQFLVMARDRFGRQRFSPTVSATTLRTSLFVYTSRFDNN